MTYISVVLPAYNEAFTIEEAIKQLSSCFFELGVRYELIVVDDGSKDQTSLVLANIRQNYAHVKTIALSRNFGKEAAIFCGLRQAKGDVVVVMDCDLQHPVATIPLMYQAWLDGYEVIEGIKKQRQKEGWQHRVFAGLFYRILEKTSAIRLQHASDFKMLDRKVVNALNELSEKHTFFRALSGWVGFKSIRIEFDVAERFAGRSKWKFGTLLSFALQNLTSFTTIPMQAVTICGVVFFVFSLVLGVNTLYNFFTHQSASGFTTVILLLLIMGSIIMFSLGVIGFYLAKLYEEIQGRPRYFVSSIQTSKEQEEEHE